ncbi:tetratricopeptide repeat protein [Leptolyngbya sp. FACHB-16]|nr:tetratricopeptide repeat protein [Leptolyngbya sp. FACHB-16]MBD2153626.1 tetratricopeptide repeat protein [Leptolyngbya sp. FACHB-16]
MRNDQVRKGLQVVMGLFFVSSLVSAMLPAYRGGVPQGTASATAEESVSPEQELQNQARGYEMVLAREPHNQVALEGLVQARLRLNDPAKAIAPLQTLVKLYPSRADYKAELSAAQQQSAKQP